MATATTDLETLKRKWKRIDVSIGYKIWDILIRVYDISRSLPGGQTPESLRNIPGLEFFEYAEQVSENDVLWRELPDIITVSLRDKIVADRILETLFRNIYPILDIRLHQTILESVVRGAKKSELRTNLKALLDASR